jgi:hypothetical protein
MNLARNSKTAFYAYSYCLIFFSQYSERPGVFESAETSQPMLLLHQSPQQRMMEFPSSFLLVLLDDPQALLSCLQAFSPEKRSSTSYTMAFSRSSHHEACYLLCMLIATEALVYQSKGQGLEILRQVTWFHLPTSGLYQTQETA